MRRHARVVTGFTLIELLVVLAILGMLVALVAPLSVRQVERARSQEEWLVLQRTVEGLAFRAFAAGQSVRLDARGTALKWQFGAQPEKTLVLQHLFFDPGQTVRIDEHGVASPGALELRQGGRPRAMADALMGRPLKKE